MSEMTEWAHTAVAGPCNGSSITRIDLEGLSAVLQITPHPPGSVAHQCLICFNTFKSLYKDTAYLRNGVPWCTLICHILGGSCGSELAKALKKGGPSAVRLCLLSFGCKLSFPLHMVLLAGCTKGVFTRLCLLPCVAFSPDLEC